MVRSISGTFVNDVLEVNCKKRSIEKPFCFHFSEHYNLLYDKIAGVRCCVVKYPACQVHWNGTIFAQKHFASQQLTLLILY